ncbi:TPA: hypothetical protein ACL2QY_000930 [Streptococcus pneumoniae]
MMTRRIAIHILTAGAIVFTISNIRKHRRTFVYYAVQSEAAPQKGLYMNEGCQNLKAKECQELLSPDGLFGVQEM